MSDGDCVWLRTSVGVPYILRHLRIATSKQRCDKNYMLFDLVLCIDEAKFAVSRERHVQIHDYGLLFVSTFLNVNDFCSHNFGNFVAFQILQEMNGLTDVPLPADDLFSHQMNFNEIITLIS